MDKGEAFCVGGFHHFTFGRTDKSRNKDTSLTGCGEHLLLVVIGLLVVPCPAAVDGNHVGICQQLAVAHSDKL